MSTRISYFFVACIAALCAMCTQSGAQDAPASTELSNEFIRVSVNPGPDEAGRFSMQTTGGDPTRPSSQNQHLIFGGRMPWTSYTTLLIDGQPYAFGGTTKRRAGQRAKYGEIVHLPTVDAGKGVVTTTGKYGDLLVTQELSLVRGVSTRMLDTARITYRITNQGNAARQVGLRVMVDTMLGSNDGAPVRAGNDAITVAKSLTGGTLPDYWQAFDNLTNPTVVSQGTLRGGDTVPPDKILFADWGTLADDPWEPTIVDNQTFIRKGEVDPDTATAIYWNAVTVEPGQLKVFTTYYGIGDVSLKAGQMALGMTAPAETTFLHERTENATITGYVQNTGGFTGRDVVISFTLPEGLELVEGALSERFAEVRPGDIIQRHWVVRPNGKWGGKAELALAVISANIETNQMARAMDIQVLKPRMLFSPAAQSLSFQATRVKPVLAQINLTPAEAFYGIKLSVEYDPAVVSPIDVSRGRAFVENDALLDGWDFSCDDVGTITIRGERRNAKPITQAEINLATLKFRVVAPGKSALRLVRAVMVDKNGDERPADISEGVIAITPEAP